MFWVPACARTTETDTPLGFPLAWSCCTETVGRHEALDCWQGWRPCAGHPGDHVHDWSGCGM